jgi:hypothetical protein
MKKALRSQSEGFVVVGPLGIEPSTYCPEGSGESVDRFLVFSIRNCRFSGTSLSFLIKARLFILLIKSSIFLA